eukprot:COSAG01_NODE_36256_length_520_cov_0.824228_2_plen_32_part_01
MHCHNVTARIGLDPTRPDCADAGFALLALIFL